MMAMSINLGVVIMDTAGVDDLTSDKLTLPMGHSRPEADARVLAGDAG
jgi:hypothetical protein